jgi:ComF family protein
MAPTKNPLAKLLEAAIDVVLPPRCLGSGEIVDAPGMVSPAFWSQLQFIEAPFCKACGIPFSFDAGENALCAACIDQEPVFDQARSAVIYNEASRDVILGFKYGDRLHATHTFVPWIMRAGQEMMELAEAIIPVPLHSKRLRERRFNQSALLAQELAKRTKKLYLPDTLLRIRSTQPQKGLSAKDRRENVRGAFAMTRPLMEKNILLIDDVFTSGATLNECAKVLKAAGAEKVGVLTIARVTKEEF